MLYGLDMGPPVVFFFKHIALKAEESYCRVFQSSGIDGNRESMAKVLQSFEPDGSYYFCTTLCHNINIRFSWMKSTYFRGFFVFFWVETQARAGLHVEFVVTHVSVTDPVLLESDLGTVSALTTLNRRNLGRKS